MPIITMSHLEILNHPEKGILNIIAIKKFVFNLLNVLWNLESTFSF